MTQTEKDDLNRRLMPKSGWTWSAARWKHPVFPERWCPADFTRDPAAGWSLEDAIMAAGFDFDQWTIGTQFNFTVRGKGRDETFVALSRLLAVALAADACLPMTGDAK